MFFRSMILYLPCNFIWTETWDFSAAELFRVYWVHLKVVFPTNSPNNQRVSVWKCATHFVFVQMSKWKLLLFIWMLFTPKVVIPDSIHHDKGFYTWRRLRSIYVFHEGYTESKQQTSSARETGGLVCIAASFSFDLPKFTNELHKLEKITN